MYQGSILFFHEQTQRHFRIEKTQKTMDPRILAIIDRYLPKDGAILLEHMSTFGEYDDAFRFVKKAAEEAGVEV